MFNLNDSLALNDAIEQVPYIRVIWPHTFPRVIMLITCGNWIVDTKGDRPFGSHHLVLKFWY
jgi:hypothetical protein